MTTIFQVLIFVLDIMWFLVIASVIMSWLIGFQVLNIRQPLVYKVYFGLSKMMEPIYRPVRKILPPMGGIDLAPMVVIIGLFALKRLLANNIGLFG